MWCKLDDIAYVGTGATPLTACKYYYENGNIAWINSSSTKVPFIAKASNFITQKAIEETNCLVYPKGTLVIAMYGEGKTRGQISELLIDAATNQACAAVRPYSEATKKYLKLFFEGNYLHIRALAEGGNQQNLSVGKIQNYEIPLPPLDEQKRILDKAKELLLQIDNIEVGKNVCQKYINQAKSKVLDLAIHGKLVSQDPNDELAIELLKRINPKAEITCDTPQYGKLPKGWCETHIGDAFKVTMGQSPDGSSLNPIDGMEFHQGKILFGNKYLRKSSVLTNSPTKIADADTLLLCVRAPVGVVNITKQRICIGRGLCCLTPTKAINLDYAFYMLTTFQEKFESQSTGSTFKAISGSIIKNEQLWLPPLSEQHRIVAKIEELFAQLDKIEASL